MENAIKSIYKWQVDAGLADKGYDDELESSFQIEEALEGFENIKSLASAIGVPTTLPKLEKELSRYISGVAKHGTGDEVITTSIPDVDRLDKACDAVVFAIGSMAKLGLGPQEMTKALLAVNKANVQKLGMERDEHGKLLKPDSFIGPEHELQKILNSIK